MSSLVVLFSFFPFWGLFWKVQALEAEIFFFFFSLVYFFKGVSPVYDILAMCHFLFYEFNLLLQKNKNENIIYYCGQY